MTRIISFRTSLGNMIGYREINSMVADYREINSMVTDYLEINSMVTDFSMLVRKLQIRSNSNIVQVVVVCE